MNNWQRLLKAPQTHWFRKILFQVHLWMGIGLGLYVLTISITGSALLLRTPFNEWFVPKTLVPTDDIPLKGDALEAKMAEVYEGYSLGFTMEGYEEDEATYIVLNKDGVYYPHYFNQYTGEDMGISNPWQIKTVEWLGDVHDDFLQGRNGRKYNGLGGALFVLMSLSGLLIWWQGRARWHEGLLIKRASSRTFMWQLHSFIGFWSLLLMFAWGVSGFQFGFPRQMGMIVSWFSSTPPNFRNPDGLLGFFQDIHFARLGNNPAESNSWVRFGWILASFLPTLLFISGFILWWKRVIMKKQNR